MVVHLRFEVDGKAALSRVLTGIADDVENWKPALEDMASDFYRTQGDVFASGGAAEGLSAWPALSPAYTIWKRNNYGGRPILVLSGRLRSALTTSGAGSIKRVTERNLELGANVPVGGHNLAALHQHGTSRMPARPVLRLTDPQKKRWVSILHTYLFEQQISNRMDMGGLSLRLERP